MKTEAKHTEGLLKPCRSHEEYDGPMWQIDEDERAEYEAKPFVRLEAPGNISVVSCHDLATISDANARRLAACWNAFDGLTTEQVERIGAGGVKELMEAVIEIVATWHPVQPEDVRDPALVVHTMRTLRPILARLEGKG